MAILHEFIINKKNKEYIDLEVEIPFGSFLTQEEANKVAYNIRIIVTSNEKKFGLMAIYFNKKTKLLHFYHINEDEIVFKRIKKEKRKIMGKPLNITSKQSLETLKDSLNETSKLYQAYFVDDNDLEVIDYDFKEFLKNYKEGTILNNTAYDIKEIIKT